MFLSLSTYIFIYIITTLYFGLLGCSMMLWRGNSLSTRGEQEAKLRITRSVGIFMLLSSLDWLIWLWPVLHAENGSERGYEICFLITLMLETPALYQVMHAIVQKRVNTLRWTCIVTAPFLLLLLWYIMMPFELCGRVPINLAAMLNILFIIALMLRYGRQYRKYVEHIKSEYSDITGRDIIWAWACFLGFSLQGIIFIIYEYTWMPWMENIYWLLSIANATFLCHCVSRQRPYDVDVVEKEDEPAETEEPTEFEEPATQEKPREEKAFYAVIEHKLEALCEQRYLYLDPDLTRETLCLRLSISSTYLKMYFHSRHTNFYQYINTLRAEYAYRLMQENPQLSIREICEQSGFRSQTTFRKMFVEVKGCLPSEVRKKS